jgi:hypothetical protein
MCERNMPESGDDMPAWGLTPIQIFLICQAVNVLGLILDELLAWAGKTTITAYVHAFPLCGVPIVALQMLSAGALAAHLWGGRH